MDATLSRKLSAILFADIAGYTAMMQKNEANALEVLDLYQANLLSLVEEYNGEIIKNYGDGSICLFSSASNAIHAAKVLQLTVKEKVPLRIGLHLGDVIHKKGDVYGDAINVASRIESMGVAGNVLISDFFYYKVKNQADLSFRSLGKFNFKNVDRTIEVYALANEGILVPGRSDIVSRIKGKLKRNYHKSALFIIPMALIIGYFLVWPSLKDFVSNKNPSTSHPTQTLAVLNYENNTGNPDFEIIGKMISDRIMHGITQNDLAMVVSGEAIEQYEKILVASATTQDRNSMLKNRFDVKKVIKGNYYLDGKDILIESVVVDVADNKVIKGFSPVKVNVENPLDGITELRSSILGYLAYESDLQLNLLLETHTPKYEAYVELLKAKEIEKDEIMLSHLEKAIALDSQYFEPKVLRLSTYYNMDEFSIADSLREVMMINPGEYDKRQRNLLNFYDALLRGKSNLAYQYFKNEYDLSPFDLMTNNTQIVLALQFINDVEAAIPMYEVIPESDLDFENCDRCRTRLYVKLFIDLAIGDPGKAIETAMTLRNNGGGNLGRNLMIRAFVQTEKWTELNEFIYQEGITSQGKDLLYLFQKATEESLLVGQDQKALEYANKAKEQFITNPSAGVSISKIHLILGELEEAESVLIEYLKSNPDRLSANALLAGIYMANNDATKSQIYLDKLESLRQPYQYGDVDYVLAQAFMIGGNEEKALDYLKTAVVQGQRYLFSQFENDYLFVPIRDQKAFQELLTYWQ